MKSIALLAPGVVLGLSSVFGAVDLLVDGKAAAGGDGSPSAPFQTIGEALKAVPDDGATVTIKGGVYPETVAITKGGTAESPLVVRAAPGESVIVSGFEPLTGWKDEGGGLYSLTSTERVNDLFVGTKRQRLARFPDDDEPWIRAIGDNAEAGMLELESAPDIPTEAGKNVYALIYTGAINGELIFPVAALDGKKVTFETGGRPFLPRTGDALIFLNATSFTNREGEWSCQPEESGWKVLFRPKNPEDLKVTQTRRRANGLRIGAPASHLRLEGLEITGGATYGIYAAGASDLVIKRCAVYANGTPGTVAGLGLRIDQCRDVTLDSCIVFANHINGLGFTQGENVTVRGCEITANDGDGVNFSGRNNAPDQPLRKVRLENCYVHRHFYLGHPDNTQIFGNVRDVTYENNVLFLAGQNAMIQQCEDMKFTNNVFFGATARHVILGHGNAHQAEFENNTFAFANFGSIGTAANGVKIKRNIFYQNVLSYESEGVAGDENMLWASAEEAPVLIHTVPQWKSYRTPQDFALEHESEANSRRENPEFKNVPLAQVIGKSTFFAGARNTIFLDAQGAAQFTVGDTIEINGDGVSRQVESVGTDSITFSPQLATLPFRNAIIWKWPKGASLQIDLTTALGSQADRPGATLDFAAYQRGELDGSGKRSLPELSKMAKAAMPGPEVFVYPFSLPAEK